MQSCVCLGRWASLLGSAQAHHATCILGAAWRCVQRALVVRCCWLVRNPVHATVDPKAATLKASQHWQGEVKPSGRVRV